MSVLVKLSDDRAEQLRAFAEAQGLGMTDAIGALLKKAGAADEVPGFKITPMRASPRAKPIVFTLAFEGFHAVMVPADILKVADHLDECATMSGIGGKKIKITYKETALGQLVVARHRRHSIVITGTGGGTVPEGQTVSRTLTLDVARDLAQQIRRAVENA